MAALPGDPGRKHLGLAGSFGVIASSCSFAAPAASRSVLLTGIDPVTTIAFLLASTNLGIALVSVRCMLLGWRFTLGNPDIAGERQRAGKRW